MKVSKILGIVSIAIPWTVTPARSQERIGQILQERDELYQQYDHYMSRNSAFFGGKSKKDLSNIVNTLKEIIQKDNELIQEVRKASQELRIQSTQKETGYIGQSRETVNRLYDLERQVSSLRSQLNVREADLKARQNELADTHAATNRFRLISLALAGGIALLFAYTVRLRRRLSPARR